MAYWGDVDRVKMMLADANNAMGNELNKRVYVDSPFYKSNSNPMDRDPFMTPLNIAIWNRQLEVVNVLAQADYRQNVSV